MYQYNAMWLVVWLDCNRFGFGAYLHIPEMTVVGYYIIYRFFKSMVVVPEEEECNFRRAHHQNPDTMML